MLPRRIAQGRQDDSHIPSWRSRVWWLGKPGYRLLCMSRAPRTKLFVSKRLTYTQHRYKTPATTTSTNRKQCPLATTHSKPRGMESTHTASATNTGAQIARRCRSTCMALCMCLSQMRQETRWRRRVSCPYTQAGSLLRGAQDDVLMQAQSASYLTSYHKSRTNSRISWSENERTGIRRRAQTRG